MKILHAAAECFPLAKTGGLGDVVAALPAACRAQGIDARVLLPGYRGLRDRLEQPLRILNLVVRGHRCAIWHGTLVSADAQLPVYLLECAELYDREGNPYGDANGAFADNAERFGVFSQAIAEVAGLGLGGFRPDLLHLHDWHTGLAAAYLKQALPTMPIVFTIHNLAYQGLFPHAEFLRSGLPASLWSYEGLEFWGQMSSIKAGIVYADRVTTVSPTHAHEIQTPEFGCGLESTLQFHAAKLSGIINGIDAALWNPMTDTALAKTYDAASVQAGKAFNRRALCEELKIKNPEFPLLAFIGRLAGQKGGDLLLQALPELRRLRLNLVILGAGDPQLEKDLVKAASKRGLGGCAVRLGYDEGLAHRIYAAADALLMPSRYEPCGLNQMYAQRYGALPIVRRTGGLADTVVDLDEGSLGNPATGILFRDADAGGVLFGVRRMLGILDNPEALSVLRQAAMAKDFSWLNPVTQYRSHYSELLKTGSGIQDIAP